MGTADQHGHDDAIRWYDAASELDQEILDDIAKMRRGRKLLPDEALINAMGRAWILKQATGQGLGDATDEAWERYGRPWCAAYSESYLNTLERLATP